jgi:1-acyl-sn-glycerol-3-phosphate acyltransferase
MKLKIRLCCKLFLTFLLFINGLIIAGGIFPLLTLLCPPGDAKNKKDFLKALWLQWFSKIINLEISKDGGLYKQGTLLVSNHISWLDIIVIGQFFPAYFVAKNDISGWPVIGFLARQSGTIFIRRGDKRHIRATAEKMVWLLKQNSTIIAFPEGTTTAGNEVLHFHASLFQPALLTRSPIQPLALHYLGAAKDQAPFIGDDGFIPHLIRILAMDKIEVHLSFLGVIDSSGKDRQSVSHEARDLIAEKIYGYSANHSVRQKYVETVQTGML